MYLLDVGFSITGNHLDSFQALILPQSDQKYRILILLLASQETSLVSNLDFIRLTYIIN